MANQESGNVKQLKLRIPMAMYRQLEIYSDAKGQPPATSARHILGDALMDIDVSTPEEKARIAQMVKDNWDKINNAKLAKEEK